jgi:hypothetical protein
MGLIGYEIFLIDLIKNKAFVERLFDMLAFANVEYVKRIFRGAGIRWNLNLGLEIELLLGLERL